MGTHLQLLGSCMPLDWRALFGAVAMLEACSLVSVMTSSRPESVEVPSVHQRLLQPCPGMVMWTYLLQGEGLTRNRLRPYAAGLTTSQSA